MTDVYQEPLAPVGRFLLLGVQGALDEDERAQLLRLHAELGEDAAMAAARANQIAPLVASQMLRYGGREVAAAWLPALDANRSRVERLMDVLRELGGALDAAGVPWAVIENGGVLFGSDMPFEAFAAGDFDLLVGADAWQDAVRVMSAAGFVADDRRDRPTNRVEFRRSLPDGTVQWMNAGAATIDRIWVPLPVADLGQAWLKERRRSHRDDAVWVLRPEHSLALVALHTSLHSYVRAPGIRLHVDVDRMTRDNRIDWDEAVDQMVRMSAETRCFVSLSMARGLLAAPVPDRVLDRLDPGAARRHTLERILRANGVVATGRRKLGRLDSVALDRALDGRALPAWLWSLVAPPREWLVSHFGDARAPESTLRLHARRYWRIATRWRPR